MINFVDREDILDHKAHMISFRVLSEVEKICDDRKISRTELAQMVETSKSYLTQLFRGDKMVNMKIMSRFELALSVNFSISADPLIQSTVAKESTTTPIK